MNAERVPVIVGAGQVNDRTEDPEQALDPIGLMAQALRRAERDAGGEWLTACDSLAVVSQIAWPHLNPLDGTLADRLDMTPTHREQTAMPNGDSPVRLLNDAANRIGAGEATICAVVGGEALRTAGRLAAAGQQSNSEKPDALRDASHRVRKGYAQAHGLVVPVDVYPLYENALRAALGQSLSEGQDETGALWSGMSEVAAANAHAWIRDPVTPADVVTASDSNRPIAFPYTKLQVANSSVNQGAGFLVTSLAEAQRRGVAEERLIFVGNGAAAHEDSNVLARADYAGSVGLEVSIEKSLQLNGVTSADLDHVELYSCFPCVPKLSRRVLGWPLDRPITVFGGLTFGGGPIGNYMSHAIASMVERLRHGGGRGLLHANGGYATYNHTILLSSEPMTARFPRSYDFQADADARRRPVPPLEEGYAGPATIETWTVHFDRSGAPRLGTIVARTPAGGRTLATVPADDADTISFLLDLATEPIGTSGVIALWDNSIAHWVPNQ